MTGVYVYTRQVRIDCHNKEIVNWVALPDVADTQVDRLLQAELSVKWRILSADNSVDYAWLDYWQAKGNNRAILQEFT